MENKGMRKVVFSLLSLACFITFMIMFAVMLSSPYGGPNFVRVMFVVPLIGIVFAIIGNKRLLSISIIANAGVFCFMLFFLFLGLAFDEP